MKSGAKFTAPNIPIQQTVVHRKIEKEKTQN